MLGFGRDPRREYPAVEDPRLVQLVSLESPVADEGYWMATLLRADGIRQSLAVACLADARDPIFDNLSEADRVHLAGPFLTAQAVA
jgi:hypothetical protein